MERYPICTFIRPQILTLTLLWQAISFQCTVLKRSRSDTLLDKDSAIATISSAWENRRTGVASCSCLICKSYPLLDEITRSPNSCPRQDLGADADRFQTLQAASSRNIRKKKLLMTRKHQDLSQPHRTCTTCFRFLKNTPKVKRCLDRGQIMKTTVVSTVVNPTFVDRMEVPHYAWTMFKYEHIKYLIGSDWVFNGYHYCLHAWPGPARAAKTNKASASSQLGTLLP